MKKLNSNIDLDTNVLEAVFIPRRFIVLWITLVYIASMLLEFHKNIFSMDSFFFTVIIVIHTIFHWYASSLQNRQLLYFFFVQLFIVFFAAFIVPNGSIAVFVGLTPILIAQSLYVYNNIFKVIAGFAFMYAIFCAAISINYGVNKLSILLSMFLLVLAIIVPFSYINKQQFDARNRIQRYIQELEFAYTRVEELTLANERQRMARDLHDTLAQGLASLIMQLEAMDAHMQKGNTGRSQEILKQTMVRARQTLHDARLVIDDLRHTTNSFHKAIEEEVQRFSEATSIHVGFTIQSPPYVSSLVKEHCLYIMSECLTNIAKHSQATDVKLKVEYVDDLEKLTIIVEDNGIGFDTRYIGKNPGHYGLIGLNERVRLIKGEIHISSEKMKGTKVHIQVPISNEGDRHEV
ncbi:sensor histidine kinase [Bacillus clarus]|uniref:histidine kinase n=1 Tax=Bacillus clarus TaxID=2338372 RepID=A0A090YUS1_9BACI|nr:sensor histidine kinase [Bacillus clarus]KFN02145.1 histidine kinase family protein [Bacillus clarus]RFT66264.1 sensor histidine kinase [Bacillus clarus]